MASLLKVLCVLWSLFTLTGGNWSVVQPRVNSGNCSAHSSPVTVLSLEVFAHACGVSAFTCTCRLLLSQRLQEPSSGFLEPSL